MKPPFETIKRAGQKKLHPQASGCGSVEKAAEIVTEPQSLRVRHGLTWKGGMLESSCTYPERGLRPGGPMADNSRSSPRDPAATSIAWAV
jgi:hypothetical protein